MLDITASIDDVVRCSELLEFNYLYIRSYMSIVEIIRRILRFLANLFDFVETTRNGEKEREKEREREREREIHNDVVH